MESNFINLLNKVQSYLESEPSKEKKNMCVAINVGEIQEYAVREYTSFFEEKNYSIKDVVEQLPNHYFVF